MKRLEALRCSELVEQVTAYLDGALSLPERRRFERHLFHCPGCAAYLEQVRQTVRWLARLPVASIVPATRQRLLAAFRERQRTVG